MATRLLGKMIRGRNHPRSAGEEIRLERTIPMGAVIPVSILQSSKSERIEVSVQRRSLDHRLEVMRVWMITMPSEITVPASQRIGSHWIEGAVWSEVMIGVATVWPASPAMETNEATSPLLELTLGTSE